MKITGITLDQMPDGSREVGIRATLENGEQLEAGDVDRLLDLLSEAAGASDAPSHDAPARPTEPAETNGRRRGAASDAEANGSAPQAPPASSATDASPRRRRGAGTNEKTETASASTAEQTVSPSDEGGRRRRRAVAEPEVPTISDGDLSKAASAAADKLTPKIVQQIIKEDFGADKVNEIPQEKRQFFLDVLHFEMTGEKRGEVATHPDFKDA